MNVQELNRLIGEAVNDADLTSAEIPSIDLYLEQILLLVADKSKEGSEVSERVLTKNMINNYSKDGLITPVKGKKYTKEQIVQMLVVYSLKNTLSIEEIKRAMEAIYAKEDYSGQKLIDAYDKAIAIKQAQKHRCPEIVQEIMSSEQLDPGDGEDYFVALLATAAMSVYFRNMAKAMLEEYPLLPSEEERKAREKEEKKERKAKKKAEAADAATAEQATEETE